MKLNLGCGKFPIKGFINVDINPAVKPDVLADSIAYLKSKRASSVDEIYLGHFLEHCSPAYSEQLLQECRRALRTGGALIVTIPDTRKAMDLFNVGAMDYEMVVMCTFGERSNEWEVHKQVFDWEILRRMLEKYFDLVTLVTNCPYWVANVEWQTTARAVK